MYYDMDGNLIDQNKWTDLFAKPDRHLATTHFICPSGEASASTVWLGLDHSFGLGPPLIFETMIFCGCDEEYQERYATKEEALAGHAEAVKTHSGKETHLLLEGQWQQVWPA